MNKPVLRPIPATKRTGYWTKATGLVFWKKKGLRPSISFCLSSPWQANGVFSTPNKKILMLLILIVIIISIILGWFWFNSQKSLDNDLSIENNKVDTNENSNNNLDVEDNKIETDSKWQIYTNELYGFKLSYPSDKKYQPIDHTSGDGWPYSIVLFSGPSGQSYYLAIEIWDDKNNFTAEHGEYALAQTLFKELNGRYISLWNINDDTVITDIIETFEFI